jgi:alkylhydroperoxidase family enzyme
VDINEAASSVFSDAELAHLTAAVGLINVWNRFAITYRFTPMVAAANSQAA